MSSWEQSSLSGRAISWLSRRLATDSRQELLFSHVQEHTLLDRGRLNNLQRLVKDLERKGVKGDYVECGVCKGGSAAVIAAGMSSQRHLWLYDCFQGMPDVRLERDGEEARKAVGTCKASREDVVQVLDRVGIRQDQYTICQGMFQDAFKRANGLPQQVALLHCDADWYDSVILVLETFYGMIPGGGCIVLDDFGYWEGCREAFYDFCAKTSEKPLLERCGSDQAFWIKGLKHNRWTIPA